jgi:hypothetical protein
MKGSSPLYVDLSGKFPRQEFFRILEDCAILKLPLRSVSARRSPEDASAALLANQFLLAMQLQIVDERRISLGDAPFAFPDVLGFQIPAWMPKTL